jgi:hypothetical protein
MITSRDGGAMPFRRAGIAFFRDGKIVEQYTIKRHHIETNANCIRVRVIGFGSAVRIDFEEVLVTAEVIYQIRQKPYAD